MNKKLVRHTGYIEWHDGREPAFEQYEYYLASDVDTLMEKLATAQARIAEFEQEKRIADALMEA